MKISACLMVKNEEKNIGRCIESFKEAVDEIIVVDTGSTDNTVEIAKKYGAKVFYYEWDNNFSNPRNYALNKATGEWIIFLDADEYFVNNTAKNIVKIIQKYKDKKMTGIICKRVNVETNTSRVIGTDYMLRIIKNDKNIRYSGTIHETPSDDGKDIAAFIEKNDELVLYHTGYSSEIVKDKIERNIKLLKKEISDGKDNGRTYFHLSDCYLALEEYDLALKYSKLYLSTGEESLGFMSRIYSNIIKSMMCMECNSNDILKQINDAIIKFPKHPEFKRYLGTYYLIQKKYSLSLESFLEAVQSHKDYNDIEINDMGGKLYNVYAHIANLYKHKNNYTKALEYYVKSLNEKKNNKMAFEELIKIIGNEKTEDIIYFIKSIYDENNKNDVKFLITELCELKKGELLIYYYNIWSKKYGEEDISYVFMLLSNGYYDKAFQYFTEFYIKTKNLTFEVFAVISAVLSDNKEKMEYIKNLVKPSLQRVIDAVNSKNSKLHKEDINDFISLLNQIILLTKEKSKLNKFIHLKDRFYEDVSILIADLFEKNNLYDLAIEQYESSLKTYDTEKENIFSKLGYCYYKLNDYDNAVEYFIKALDNHYKNNDINEFLIWIYEQSDDENLKEKIILRIGLENKDLNKL